MNRADDLDRVVVDAIKAGRIGQPVFIRLMVPSVDPSDNSLAVAVPWLLAVQRWVADQIGTLHVVRARESGVLTVSVRFRRGATALVSTAGTTSPTFDLVLLGNRGAIYQEGLRAGMTGFGVPTAGLQPEAATALRKALERSLERGGPEQLREDSP